MNLSLEEGGRPKELLREDGGPPLVDSAKLSVSDAREDEEYAGGRGGRPAVKKCSGAEVWQGGA